jgi:hypothetical protein
MRHSVSLAIIACACACRSHAPAPATPDAPQASDAAPSFDESGMVVDKSSTPVANAYVCIVDHPEVPCVEDDGSGVYHLSVPATLERSNIAIATTLTTIMQGYLGSVLLVQEAPPFFVWPAVSTVIADPDATTYHSVASRRGARRRSARPSRSAAAPSP